MKTFLYVVMASVGLFQCADDEVPNTPCGIAATVRDLSGLDGCGFVFQLQDGTYLQPLRVWFCGTPPLPEEQLKDPLYDFEFIDGKEVYIDYEVVEDYGGGCMAGEVARITCISDRNAPTAEE